MGRRPIDDAAMTPADRQNRRSPKPIVTLALRMIGPWLALFGGAKPRKLTMEDGMPIIIYLNAEAAKLIMFRKPTLQTTFVACKGSAAKLSPYRDGALLLSK
jgi:hypothetical protein